MVFWLGREQAHVLQVVLQQVGSFLESLEPEGNGTYLQYGVNKAREVMAHPLAPLSAAVYLEYKLSPPCTELFHLPHLPWQAEISGLCHDTATLKQE